MRPLTPEMVAALQQPVIRPALLMRGEFVNGDVLVWSGLGPLSWNGETYLGAGQLIGISEVEETSDIKSNGVQVSLSAVQEASISLALLEMQRNLPGEIWFGLLEEDGATLIPSPFPLFRGRLDTVRIQDSSGAGSVLILSYENELIDLERARELRYTSEEQRRLYPGDSFLDFIGDLQDKPLRWGSTT